MVDPIGGPVFWLPLLLGFLAGYLLGSVPFAYILTRAATGTDIRSVGSGNVGATNVLRTGRKSLALAVLIADLAKGAAPVALAFAWFGPDMAVMVGLGAVIGHCFPVWLRFQGGKGVATAAGVILGLTPWVLPVPLLVFIAAVWATRFVSLGSILAALAAPVTAYLMGHVQAAELYLAIGVLVTAKHWSNIRRLLAGNENKLVLSKKSS